MGIETLLDDWMCDAYRVGEAMMQLDDAEYDGIAAAAASGDGQALLEAHQTAVRRVMRAEAANVLART